MIGGNWVRVVEVGVQECAPWEVCFKCAAPSQGAKFTTCHDSRPSSHVLIAPSLTEPVTVVAKCFHFNGPH